MISDKANIWGDPTIGENVKIGAFAEVGRAVVVGNNVAIGMGAFLCENVIIEDDVFIAPRVCFTNDKNPPSRGKWREFPPTVVKKGAVIGANSTILPNITIGENAVVGAGAVVTKDVPDNVIVVGNPARQVGTKS